MVELSWTKGHATDLDLARGRTTVLRREGNIKADELAGKARRRRKSSPHTTTWFG